MKPSLPALLFAGLLCACDHPQRNAQDDFQQTISGLSKDSGVKRVDALVAQLVSKRPAPLPSGYWGAGMDADSETPEVVAAIQSLKEMGPQIFPALVKHLRDDRYCYSSILAAWVNWSVGETVVQIMEEGTHCPYEYKDRKTASGRANGLIFSQYLYDHKPEEWAEWAKDKTRVEIQRDYLLWCFAREKERGFTDDVQQKKIVGSYERALAEVGTQKP